MRTGRLPVHLGWWRAPEEGKMRTASAAFMPKGSQYCAERRREEGPWASGAWDPQPSGAAAAAPMGDGQDARA
jgi:hypothetical protein